MPDIDLFKRYTKKDIATFLEFDERQLKDAESRKLLVFMEGGMYGVYFFQFLRSHASELESIKNSVYLGLTSS